MTKSKLLITGGCSFSSPRGIKEKKTWVEYFHATVIGVTVMGMDPLHWFLFALNYLVGSIVLS